MTEFGAKLHELREAAGLTQQQLGAKAGMTQATIARYERGDREPTWAAVAALADALGVTCQEFREPAAGDVPRRGPGRPPNKPPADAPPARPGRKKGKG